MSTVYHSILKNFPKGYSLAFAYGSGVFKQIGHKNVMTNMKDFIIVVDNPVEWHRENLALNYKHYSFLRYGGAGQITDIQDNYGSKVYFNTLVPTHEGMIKYGVVSRKNLIIDLLDWDSLYVAGRLHKPVLMLHKAESSDDDLNNALKINTYSAIHTALLILPESFSEEQFYMTIAGLSYMGDFRMLVGEDNNKVSNIVRCQIPDFRSLYNPILKELKDYMFIDTSTGWGQQDTSYPAKLYHLSMLPKNLQHMLVVEWNKDKRSTDLEDVLRSTAQDPDSSDIVIKGVQDIVRTSSLTQSIKGILTAGIYKSVVYSLAKMQKKWSSLQK